ncbi:putative disease resistance protein RGA1 [Triticum aestivum]|uniref:putative disease resistance protein RGA1 n=1 Tax=Triticum aestivum TaxID=4565 RepID=UPI001D017F54|nr:putative disease resistance protein RGA1 [Triticum aestivum]
MAVQGVAWGISVAGWIMSPIISKLLDKVLSYCKFDKEETLRHLLTDVLPRLTLTLEAADAINHRLFLGWTVRRLKSAFYDIEDILDELEYIRHQKKLDKQKRSPSKRTKIASYAEAGPSNQDICIEPGLTLTGDLNRRLKNHIAKIEELIVAAQGIIALAKPPSKGETSTARNIQTHTTSTPTEKVTGRDEDRDQIAKMLHDKDEVNPSSSDNRCFSAIGIYGISGSGKTTLAQHVCNVGDIFREMLEAVDKNSCRAFSGLDMLENELENKLKGKRFLLVLDDIWCNKDVHEQKLARLLSPLNLGKQGSKILATSRNEDAFSDLGSGVKRKVFPIRALDDEAFLNLFMYYALEDANADDPDQIDLKTIGAEIAKKLKGSPLAASTVGGQLRARQKDVEFWREVRDGDLVNETTGALWWSYQHLDEQVRRCFAYCSIFPRRHRLNRDELVKLWVAEGFIQTTDAEKDMEAVGRDYFHELLATSFVQPGGYYQGSDCYIVHDLMHDLAEKVAGSDCFRIENGLRSKVPRHVRHLYVANAAMVTKDIFELENLRTLIVDDTEWLAPVNNKFFEKVFKKLKKLRVLAVETAWKDNFDLKLPESIGHLKHLRYLGLVIFEAGHVFPKTLANLYHLQVLKFCYSSDVQVSPGTNMSNLTNLRHIIGEMTMHVPNMGRITSLQTLECFGVKMGHGYELHQLSNLNKLRGNLKINGLENVESKEEAEEAKLVDKERLTGLKLHWYNDPTCLEVQEEVLEGLCPPKGLKSLEIWGYESQRYPSWMVGEQNGGPKNLHQLRLCRSKGPAPEIFNFFIHLRELTISSCSLDHLPDNMKDLSYLKRLKILRCLHLKSLPELPGSLQKFKLKDCDESFMRSCEEKDHSNWQKIQHVDVKDIGFRGGSTL